MRYKSLLCEHYLHGELHTYAAFLAGAPATKTLEDAVYKMWVRKRSGSEQLKLPMPLGTSRFMSTNVMSSLTMPISI